MNIQLFLEKHVATVYDYELSLLSKNLSSVRTEIKSWQSSWRKESLKHYCGSGWSFVAFEEDRLQGYVLAQPLLFFNNWTQSLWLEHLSFHSDRAGTELMDVCIRWAKTKHLQKLLVNTKTETHSWIQKRFPSFKRADYLHLSTTKINESDS